MKINSFWIFNPFRCFIAFCVMAYVFISSSDNQAPKSPTNELITETDLTYFIESLIEEIKTIASNSDTLGLGGGVYLIPVSRSENVFSTGSFLNPHYKEAALFL